MDSTSEYRKCDNGREIILLGFLNVDNIYGENWYIKKNEIKKDIELRAVKLNQAFKYPAIFHEKFEFLSAEDYNYVKNNYIYSAILIFNPNLEKKNADGADIHGSVVDGSGDERGSRGDEEKKKEGIGVLVVTCKKMEKAKMKNILIKMLKKEIKVESTVLRYNNLPSASTRRRETNINSIKKQTEIKHLENSPTITVSPVVSNLNKPFDVKRNNFFNMTAYIYGSSSILANTSLIQREYGDDEWAEKLRKKKKEKEEMGNPPSEKKEEMPKENRLIRSFAALFKK
ncbi:conserved Plasmodium protein, unknown function [Plasmodium ovale]|nr:conserved Plasmodium protein, unknown function [Plasmodium ovale]